MHSISWGLRDAAATWPTLLASNSIHSFHHLAQYRGKEPREWVGFAYGMIVNSLSTAVPPGQCCLPVTPVSVPQVLLPIFQRLDYDPMVF
jgi:hypothetical protein